MIPGKLLVFLCEFVIQGGYIIFLEVLCGETVPFIEEYFPIFARASSACTVALRLLLSIAHINKSKLEIDVNVEMFNLPLFWRNIGPAAAGPAGIVPTPLGCDSVPSREIYREALLNTRNLPIYGRGEGGDAIS